MNATQMFFFVTAPFVCMKLSYHKNMFLEDDKAFTRFEPTRRQANATSQTRSLWIHTILSFA